MGLGYEAKKLREKGSTELSAEVVDASVYLVDKLSGVVAAAIEECW
jgi:hypothetical protein